MLSHGGPGAPGRWAPIDSPDPGRILKHVTADALAIVRALDEAATIGGVIDDLRRHCPGVDVLVVDDGSRDATAARARAAGARVVSLPFNLGMGGAVQTGYRLARDEGYARAVQLDGDGQHPAREAARLLRAVGDDGWDMAVGSRFAGGGGYRPGPLRRLGIRALSAVASVALGRTVTDATSGLRAVGRGGIALFAERHPHDYVELETLLLAARHGLRVTEVPVAMRPRAAGRSTITPGRTSVYALRAVLGLAVVMADRRTVPETG